MNTLTALGTMALMVFASGVVSARDIGPAEADKLRAAGNIQPQALLNAAALARHPGATITDTDLDEEYGRHVHQVELTDVEGIDWDVDLDAATGQILKDHQDH
jgi:uncharacterized membrane protein YkoI